MSKMNDQDIVSMKFLIEAFLHFISFISTSLFKRANHYYFPREAHFRVVTRSLNH